VKCQRCPTPLELVVAIDERGLPPSSPDHDTVYDWSKVLSCPGCGFGELRVFSHDCWPSEDDVDMEWSTQLPPSTLTVIRDGLAGCPDPVVPACECPVHVSLRETRTRPGKLRIRPRRDGTRPDAFVVLRDDGVPEFIYTPTA
jgi:hypothetical protein